MPDLPQLPELLSRLAEVARKLALSESEHALVRELAQFELGADAVRTQARRRPSLATLCERLGHDLDVRVLLPSAPLRRYRLLESQASRFDTSPLSHQPLALSERLLGHLLGSAAPDERVAACLELRDPLVVLTPSQSACAHAIAMSWRAAEHFEAFRPIALCGDDAPTLRAIAWEAARVAGMHMAELHCDRLPDVPVELRETLRLLELEALLDARALFIDTLSIRHLASRDRIQEVARDVAARCDGPRVLAVRPETSLPENAVRFDAPRAAAAERAQLIRALVPGAESERDTFAERLASQFELSAPATYEACKLAVAMAALDPSLDVQVAAWRACRECVRPRLSSLAQAIESRASFADLVLPDTQHALLREAAAQVRHRDLVYRQWGFADKGTRGLSLTALFSGPSGTGKTLAAEVLANDLGLDLLRVDLSAVISKYIGETEKNLAVIFDAAEAGGAVLLFDEADALFGPRSKVNDSHDRHANIEVSFLLQRLEAFRGLAILTTNFRENIDQAFLRRIRFHVEFPFPDRVMRARLWRSAFPASTPLAGVDFERLSRLSLTGGLIRNIALNSAFLAASEGRSVQMSHVVASARVELRKNEKPIPEGELRRLLAVVDTGGDAEPADNAELS